MKKLKILLIGLLPLLCLLMLQSCQGARTGFKIGTVYTDKKTGGIYEVNGEFYIEKRDGNLEKTEKKPSPGEGRKEISVKDNGDGTMTIDGKQYKKEKKGVYILIPTPDKKKDTGAK